EESTTSLLTSRETVIERLHYYHRLLGLPIDPNAPETITLNRPELTEENFVDVYNTLVGQYDKPIARQNLPQLTIVGDASPAQQSGASGHGRLYLNTNEDAELNTHLPTAREMREASGGANLIASSLTPIPSGEAHLAFWGIGIHSKLFSGEILGAVAKIAAEVLQIAAAHETDQAGMASRTASHERRADEWIYQYNLAAHELMQNGRQILASLIAE